VCGCHLLLVFPGSFTSPNFSVSNSCHFFPGKIWNLCKVLDVVAAALSSNNEQARISCHVFCSFSIICICICNCSYMCICIWGGCCLLDISPCTLVNGKQTGLVWGGVRNGFLRKGNEERWCDTLLVAFLVSLVCLRISNIQILFIGVLIYRGVTISSVIL